MANGMVDLAVHQWSEDKKSSWVQIMTTGEWDRPQKQPDGTFKPSKVRITPADLHKFKENFDKGVRGVKLFTDIAHKPDDGAVAEWEELEVRGNKLYARMAWTDEGAQIVKSGKYNYFSPEFSFAWTDPATGKVHKDVLFGGALTNRPFLKDMERVALSETEDVDMFQLKFADGEPYDPDHDGDNDKTANPKLNPDWMEDVRQGITPWSVCTPDQKQQLIAKGITHHVANRAHAEFMAAHPHLKMSGDGITNSHDTPPKGKPKNKALYADPDNYKYPIDKKHVHAAVDFYNESGMQSKGGYTDSQWKSIGERIAKAAGFGYSLKDGKIETPFTHKMNDSTYDPEGSPDEEDGVATPHKPDDTDSGKYNEPGGGVLRMTEGITMAEWEAAQNKIKALEESERRHKFAEQARGWMFDESKQTGKLLPAQQDKVIDLMMGMTDEQVQKFSEFVDSLAPVVSFSEAGTSASIRAHVKESNKEDEIYKLAERYEREEHMEWKDAFLRASDELEVK
ncbi:phage protease [Alicyclobacillus ferrooxydans]|uniref:Uncharacterized protein n=1 Tax=Alicyclobacillus ferrooxydans TaxID=471514 RepID=A0A0P9CYK9_9BACL|nr:phage protease [Alicyclobacillus ferrooxydans]KPV42014.1 hypothetical protein AN477_19795 [Alicyclobacillus ferrooxydans]